MIFAIDFDGTIVKHEYPKIGDLRPRAKSVINKLYDKGHYIIIWTCRNDPELTEAINYLKMIRIKYHKVNENAPLKLVGFKTAPKIFANVYIDDLNLGGFPGWDYVRKLYLKEGCMGKIKKKLAFKTQKERFEELQKVGLGLLIENEKLEVENARLKGIIESLKKGIRDNSSHKD